MRCKIVRFQKLMWHNMMRSTKSQKALVLHYNINYKECKEYGQLPESGHLKFLLLMQMSHHIDPHYMIFPPHIPFFPLFSAWCYYVGFDTIICHNI